MRLSSGHPDKPLQRDMRFRMQLADHFQKERPFLGQDLPTRPTTEHDFQVFARHTEPIHI